MADARDKSDGGGAGDHSGEYSGSVMKASVAVRGNDKDMAALISLGQNAKDMREAALALLCDPVNAVPGKPVRYIEHLGGKRAEPLQIIKQIGELEKKKALTMLVSNMPVGERTEHGLDAHLATAIILSKDGVGLAEKALVMEKDWVVEKTTEEAVDAASEYVGKAK
ncbi:hypothetical protein N0V88_001502 [Collariella sp. IMI 366227]|nr:hypothetical protein N0V88_001502 [Collariella sp. IMI 366227]